MDVFKFKKCQKWDLYTLHREAYYGYSIDKRTKENEKWQALQQCFCSMAYKFDKYVIYKIVDTGHSFQMYVESDVNFLTK